MVERWGVREIKTGKIVGTYFDADLADPTQKKFGNSLRSHEWDSRERFDLILYPMTQSELDMEEEEQPSLEERLTARLEAAEAKIAKLEER